LKTGWSSDTHHRDRHQQDQATAQTVDPQDQLAAREAIREPGQEDAAEQRRDERQRVGESGQRGRPRVGEDQHRQRHPSQLITGDRLELGQPHRPELRYPEHLFVARIAHHAPERRSPRDLHSEHSSVVKTLAGKGLSSRWSS
jgi:hypothetical protein